MKTLSELFEDAGPMQLTARGETDNTVVDVHAITSDGYALCTSKEEGALGSMRIFDAYLPVWDYFRPAPVLHTYKLQSTAETAQKIRPVLILGFYSKADAEYYCQQHDYRIVAYVGEETLT